MADGNVSRRSFCVGGATLLSSLLLPQIEGMEDCFSLLPFGAEKAYAADGDSSIEGEVMVVSRTQVGIVAYDVTDPSAPKVVPGCKVSVTSRYNGKSVEGTADDDGRIIFDLKDLAEDPDAELPAFNGSIEVTFDGYRDVVIPLTRVVAHAVVVVPTRPLDGKPYFRSLAMNDWDIQYSKATFLTASSCDQENLIEGKLWLPAAGAVPTAKLILVQDGKETSIGTFKCVKTEGSIATLQVSGAYLKTGDKAFIGENASLKVDFSLSGANEEYWMEASVQTEPAPLEDDETGEKVLFPELAGQGVSIVRFPDTFVPPFGGGQLTIWKPSFPIIFEYSHYGYAMLGAAFSRILAKNDDGSFFDTKSWSKVPSEGLADQCGTEFDRQVKAIDAYDKAKAGPDDPDKTQSVWHQWMKTVRINFDAQFIALLKYTWKTELWEGSCSGIVAAKLDFNWTRQFFFLTVPMFFTINAWGNLQGLLKLSMLTKSLKDFDWQFHKGWTLGINFSVGLGLTLGVGVDRCISASFTGGGYLSSFLNFATNTPGKMWPRILLGYGHSGILTLQFLLFKYTGPIWNENHPDAFDTNDYTSNGSAFELPSGTQLKESFNDVLKARLGKMGMRDSVPVSISGLPSFAELKENALIVTNEQLLGTKEFQLSRGADYDNAPVSVFEQASGASTNSIRGVGDGLVSGSTFADIIVMKKDGVETVTDDYLPEYTYVGTMAAEDPDTALGIGGVSEGSRGGVKPKIDRALFKGVHSDARMELLVTKSWGRTVLFRIATVDIGDKRARSRVVYHVLQSNGSWGRPWVVDFDPQIEGVSRDDMYDYEFAVTQAAGGEAGVNHIFLLITSGTRPDGDDTSFTRGIQAHQASLVALYDSGASENPLRVQPAMTTGLLGTEDGYTLTTPRLTGFSDEFSIAGTNDFCVMGFYTRREVDEDEGISSSGTTLAFFARQELDSTYSQKVFKVTRQRAYNPGDGSINDFTMAPVRIDDDEYKWESGSVANQRRATFAYTGNEWSTIGKLEAVYTDHDSTKFSSFDCTDLVNISSSKMHVHRFYPWSDDGTLLATCESVNEDGEQVSSIYQVTFDPKSKGEATFSELGIKNGSTADFAMDPGHNFLFYPQNIDGTVGLSYTEDGERDPQGDVVEHHHYIMAVAYVDGLFTRPFIFCELDHLIDGFVAATVQDRYVTFMANCITDIDRSTADIYDVRVPLVKCLTPVSLVTVEPFALSGEDCEFSIEVRNDGNLVACAATFTLYDAQGNKVDSKRVTFGKDAVARPDKAACDYDTDKIPSHQLQNELVVDDGCNVLVPGASEQYRVIYAIPDDWSDKTTVYVKLSDIEVITPTNANSGFQEYHIADGDCPTLELALADEVSGDGSGLSSGEVHVKSTDDGGDDDDDDDDNKKSRKGSDSGSGGSSGSGSDDGPDGGSGGSTSPQTGDSLLGNMALAAAGALGAGMLAYSARRTALAQQDASAGADADDAADE